MTRSQNARVVNTWSSHSFPANYAPVSVPVSRANTLVCHEKWNAERNHWTLMLGDQVLCDCGRRDDGCRRCQRGRQ